MRFNSRIWSKSHIDGWFTLSNQSVSSVYSQPHSQSWTTAIRYSIPSLPFGMTLEDLAPDEVYHEIRMRIIRASWEEGS